MVEEPVDESYDPTADFFRAAPPSMTPMYQPEYKEPVGLNLTAVPIPEGAVPQVRLTHYSVNPS